VFKHAPVLQANGTGSDLTRFAPMAESTFEEGYRAGWEGVAGTAPLPDVRTCPPDEPADYVSGFKYGRADALERFKPRR
jgi:hypothetical protein